MQEVFTHHLNLSDAELEKILSLSLTDLLESQQIQDVLSSLDIETLKETLPTAAGVLAERLPPFYNWLKNELGVQRVPDSPDHTTKWVIGFVNHQESLTRLVELHRPVPKVAVEGSVSPLVGAFDGVQDNRVRKEWQKAVAALCLPLVVAAREEERSHLVEA